MSSVASHIPLQLPAAMLDALMERLAAEGYTPIGPTASQGAVVYAEIASAADLPRGLTEQQSGGRYRLEETGGDAFFGFSHGPGSFKAVFHPARETVMVAEVEEGGLRFSAPPDPAGRYALFGARACDLAALAVQDRVLLGSTFRDEAYALRREETFVVAVSCAQAGGTCFCASMGTGPRPTEGFDLCLTELTDGGHRFLVEIGSDAGAALIAPLNLAPAPEGDSDAADAQASATAEAMGTKMEPAGVAELLRDSAESPRWQAVAERCLACGNCTMVCPTCFCTDVVEVADLTGARSERVKVWDSCFNASFSYVHGGPVRRQTAARYRQWLTHKLSTWHDQFGTSGCVGCGRCTTWCPVGIDLTEEVAALRAEVTQSDEGEGRKP